MTTPSTEKETNKPVTKEHLRRWLDAICIGMINADDETRKLLIDEIEWQIENTKSQAIAAKEEEILEGLERWVKNARYLGEKEFLNKLNSLRNKHK